MDKKIKKIIIVGGGTAGWLTAIRLAHDHCSNREQGLSVTVVESPDVKTIGVGEGSWPTLRLTLRELGISEIDFIRKCDVSFKQGSKFIGWCTGEPGDAYYHPFTPPEGMRDVDIYRTWLDDKKSSASFADYVCAQPKLCELGFAPKQIKTPEYAAFSNYGYHLDSGKFGEYLKNYGCDTLGVNHLVDHVESVTLNNDGYMEALVCRHSGKVEADLFIDCSGSKGLLIGQHFNVPMQYKENILFNDRALAVHAPYRSLNDNIASSTLSTAQEAGWIWDIGLPSRRGVGYVYSSIFTDEEQVWKRMQDYLASTCSKDVIDTLEPKRLRFEPGYRKTPWVKNCLAIGMSAGFIEPLEASAIAMIEVCSKTLSNELPATREAMAIVARRFNKRFSERWESVICFLKLHYILSERDDTDYWRENRRQDTIPETLQEFMTLWQYECPSTADFHQLLELFGPPSYQYVLYGMGFRPKQRAVESIRDNDHLAQTVRERIAMTYKDGLRGLPTNRDLLNSILAGNVTIPG